ncbi:unnamed protein product [Bursaphelenchus okinawaensis]|uniref:Uncharacterized protein n=1 Tax=Bursaphelenchus okinawaensis TaxID=465554 RepID=A0A811KCG2_9BILA|nr:unnamed protein product [Bursaphelenchus okinawaensis]CAG9098187.1 unnamed protein product [Bursaphelenchus okinawaensis]
MLGMVLLVLLCLVSVASSQSSTQCYECRNYQAPSQDQSCFAVDENTPLSNCQLNSCFELWGSIKTDHFIFPAVIRSCNFTLPPGETCIQRVNYPYDDNLKMDGTLCGCNGTKCNHGLNPFTDGPTTPTTTIATTTTATPKTTTTTTTTSTHTTTTTTKITTTTVTTTTKFKSTTDPDAPVASTNGWSLSVLTLLTTCCAFYVL